MLCLTGQYIFLHFAVHTDIDTTNIKPRSVKHKSETTHRLIKIINLSTPELYTSAQRCLTKFFTGYFAS
jgi:hypothetical protein